MVGTRIIVRIDRRGARLRQQVRITVVISDMATARSKLTAQGQISIPVRIRRKLGVGPGSVLEWDEEGDKIIVRRAGTFSSKDIRDALFPEGPPPRRSI